MVPSFGYGKASGVVAGKCLIRAIGKTFQNVRNIEVGFKNDRQFKSSSRFGSTCPVNTSVVEK